MPCEHCTGSHWLLDDERLGPCACVTPEGMQELEGETDALRDDYEELQGRVESVVAALHDYLRSIGASPDALRHPNPHLDALVDAVAICGAFE